MAEGKTYYTYQKFKQLTEERRWLTKIYAQEGQGEWESCGKGILKFFQLEEGRLVEVKHKKQLSPLPKNFFLVVDGFEVRDNTPEELNNCLRFSNVLKSHN